LLQHGFENNEDLIAVNAFGIVLNLDTEAKHSLIVTDSTRMIDPHRKSSVMNTIDSSSGPYLPLSFISITTAT
ncbi:unnamed protein product, partial [Rotaria sp. Silwood2]